MTIAADLETSEKATPVETAVKYPGVPVAMDGTGAVVAMETAASEAAGAYPITPSTQMGEGWAVAAAQGKTNVNGRRLLFFEPEGEHAAAGVTAGMAMMGLRSTNFSSGQGIAYMHESLYAAVGKRLTYVLNIACRAMTKHALNVHAGHDDYHGIDDTGFFQLFAKDSQEAADLNLIAHRLAELALNPGVCAQDGFLTSHVLETFRLPERELVREYLGDPADLIVSPTPAQRLIFGEQRRRIPELFDFDSPAMLGTVQNQDSYAQGVAAQRPFFFDHVAPLTDQAMAEYAALTGRRYRRASGYRMEGAEYVLLGQGSVVANAEAVADWLREQRGLAVGVVNVTMFRPFPADLLVELLAGCRAVVVLERTDQPLAVDGPLLREVRAALAKGVENGRATGNLVGAEVVSAPEGDAQPATPTRGLSVGAELVSARAGDAQPVTPTRRPEGNGHRLPHPGLPACTPEQVPDLYGVCFGLGSRDLQPGDLVAAVENMLPGGSGRRQVYLGVEFQRREGKSTARLGDWQERVVAAYPEVAQLALPPGEDLDLLPPGSLALRIHSIGGWGAITMGKNLTLTVFDLLGLQVKANPKYGSEKKGQPTTFYAVFAPQPVRLNCELEQVHVVLSPDPAVFRHSDPLAGLAPGGVFVIQGSGDPAQVWGSFPRWAREAIRERGIRVFTLDAFDIARAETDVADLQFRMQGTAFQGAFFKAAPLMERSGLSEETLFQAVRAQLVDKFGGRGETVVEDNFRVLRRGYQEVREIAWQELGDEAEERVTHQGNGSVKAPWYYRESDKAQGIADPHRFLCQVAAGYREGEDPLVEPFAALSAMPAASSVFRDMTGIRFEVPELIASRCTGCGQCWTQCPDSAIPGLVSEIGDVLAAGLSAVAGEGLGTAALQQLLPELAEESRALLREDAEYHDFGSVVTRAYDRLAASREIPAEGRDGLEASLDRLAAILADFPLARTAPFFIGPERRQEGSGGLLSVTINPYACKGCNLCVEVCPDEALVAVRQDEAVVERLKERWSLWESLPDTPDRFLQVSDLDEGIGVLHTLLLKRESYLSMLGGDGSCMGCGEKTATHLVVAAIEAAARPRVAQFVDKLGQLIRRLEAKGAEVLSAKADIPRAMEEGRLELEGALDPEDRARLGRLYKLVATLEDLRWRYTSGPSGRGRAALGISNATGCSSVWGSTYPYNPYPYPWVNHLFQDAPSVGIGLFEGLMRKMADAFSAVRQAELEVEGAYDPEAHDAFFEAFDWKDFSDEEYRLCPPLVVVGGDGAMLDIGFQNLSRLLASGKPLKVLVLDTQVYSNTGGQACTSGFLGQISDMAPWGAAQQGKEEQRKELGLIAMAHRGAYVLQSSQASAGHLMAGVLRGLASRRPAVFNLYTPCQAEHGISDSGSAMAAKLALESRAFPYFVYDPDAGATFPERLSLEGNPAVEQDWPTYELTYRDEEGRQATLTLPMTTADWAATEPRFARHFRDVPRRQWDDQMIPLHELLALGAEGHEGKTPYIQVVLRDGTLGRRSVSSQMVALTEDRRDHWGTLRELAGVRVPDRVRAALEAPLVRRYEQELAALREEHEAKVAELTARYPALITRRIAEVLVGGGLESLAGREPTKRGGNGAAATPPSPRPAAPPVMVASMVPEIGEDTGPDGPPAASTEAPAAPGPTAAAEALDPWIETELCTSCDECIRINPEVFAYDGNKQAYIKDAGAGTFKEVVQAAEKCTARCIHPGTPLNSDEPDLDKWVKRAEPFQ
jgi:pyruvate-ferredoxin/flavodoxin oxidoreductase